MRRPGTTSSDVPVNPVWPKLVAAASLPMNQGWLISTPRPWSA